MPNASILRPDRANKSAIVGGLGTAVIHSDNRAVRKLRHTDPVDRLGRRIPRIHFKVKRYAVCRGEYEIPTVSAHIRTAEAVDCPRRNTNAKREIRQDNTFCTTNHRHIHIFEKGISVRLVVKAYVRRVRCKHLIFSPNPFRFKRSGVCAKLVQPTNPLQIRIRVGKHPITENPQFVPTARRRAEFSRATVIEIFTKITIYEHPAMSVRI